MNPLRTGKPIDEKRLSHSTEELINSLLQMERIFLNSTPFLNSLTMSIADLIGVSEVKQIQLGLNIDIRTNYPKVSEWAELVRQTLGCELFDEAHKNLASFGNNLGDMDLPLPKV